MVGSQDEDRRTLDVRQGRAADAGELDVNALQAAEAAGRLGERGLPGAGRLAGRSVESPNAPDRRRQHGHAAYPASRNPHTTQTATSVSSQSAP